MKKFAKLLVVISLLIHAVALSGCAGMVIQEFKAGVELPYSGNCFFVNAVDGREYEYDAPTCERMRKRGLIVLSEDWKVIRKILQTNCQLTKCRELEGRFDALFLVIDEAAKKLPLK